MCFSKNKGLAFIKCVLITLCIVSELQDLTPVTVFLFIFLPILAEKPVKFTILA